MTMTRAQRGAITRALNIIAEANPEYTDSMTSPELSQQHLRLFFAAHDLWSREHFVVTYLTSQNTLIATEVLFSGTIDGAAVYPREVAKAALQHNAAAVVLAHNHPSGCTEPSTADRRITDRLVQGLQLLGIRVLDHIIVTPSSSTSMAQLGLITD